MRCLRPARSIERGALGRPAAVRVPVVNRKAFCLAGPLRLGPARPEAPGGQATRA